MILGTEPMILVPDPDKNPITTVLEGCGCSYYRARGAGDCNCGSLDGGGS